MNTKSILVLDTETIGLDKNSRIIEIPRSQWVPSQNNGTKINSINIILNT